MSPEVKKLTATYAGYCIGLALSSLFLDMNLVAALAVGIGVGRLTS